MFAPTLARILLSRHPLLFRQVAYAAMTMPAATIKLTFLNIMSRLSVAWSQPPKHPQGSRSRLICRAMAHPENSNRSRSANRLAAFVHIPRINMIPSANSVVGSALTIKPPAFAGIYAYLATRSLSSTAWKNLEKPAQQKTPPRIILNTNVIANDGLSRIAGMRRSLPCRVRQIHFEVKILFEVTPYYR